MHLQHEDGEGDDHDRLQQREDAEAREVADDELPAAQWRRHEPLERAARALAQEGHRREQEDEEKREERDEHRREVVEERVVIAAVQALDLDVRSGHRHPEGDAYALKASGPGRAARVATTRAQR